MAEIVEEKTTGLKFAEKQLLRHGWEKGKGLGKSENGISEAIKVKIKSGKGGMGHKEGEQFSFHWWDHVFNKASSSLVVEAGQNGVMVKTSHDGSNGLISNKKPRKAQQAKSMLYGCFVKSATLLSGEEQPEKASDSDDSSSSSSSEDEDQKLDLSSTTKLSDADLLKACGGRTAHKGARHGLTMCAKLARLEQQEQEFMNKYGKKNHNAERSSSNKDCLNPERHQDIKEQIKRKKSKKQEESPKHNIHETSKDTEDDHPKKRKDSNGASVNDNFIENTVPKKKKKRNTKEKEAPVDCFNGDSGVNANEEGDTHLSINDGMKKKKKKQSEMDSEVVSETADTKEISEDSTDIHGKQPQEGSFELQQTSDIVSKRKKKKKSKHHETSPSTDVENSCSLMTVAEDFSNDAQVMDTQTEGQENNRKKKKSQNEEQEEVPKRRKKKKSKVADDQNLGC